MADLEGSLQRSPKREAVTGSEDADVVGVDDCQTSILVSNLPDKPGIDAEYIELLFESRKFGRPDIAELTFQKDDGFAILTFEKLEHVRQVLEKRPVSIKGTVVDVAVYVPPVLNSIMVKGPSSLVNENFLDTFEIYFEHRKSSGGEIENITFDKEEEAVVITFKDVKVAERVVAKKDHVVCNAPVTVEIYRSHPAKMRESGSVERSKKQKSIVKIRGMNQLQNVHSAKKYFEGSLTSDAVVVEEMRYDDENDDVAYVTFQDPKAAMDVVKTRRHVVDGICLEAESFEPPPLYSNKVLLTGLASTTSKEMLELYMKARAGLKVVPDSITYHAEKYDTVLCTTETDINLDQLKRVCSRYMLNGCFLQPHSVPMSNCVLVSNIGEASHELLHAHFENERRSCGGFVDRVILRYDGISALVYFQDYKVVDRVVAHQHTVGGVAWDVLRYIPCIKKSEDDFKLTAPITMKVSDHLPWLKLKFFKHAPTVKRALEKQMKSCNASIDWPDDKMEGDITIRRRVNSKEMDAGKNVKSWDDIAVERFEDFMKDVVATESCILPQDVRSGVKSHLKTLNVPDPETVMVYFKQTYRRVFVVGMKHTAKPIIDKVRDILELYGYSIGQV